jgi:hypothetical protein
MSHKGQQRQPEWSSKEKLKLQAYADRGLSTREAGILLGRSWAAVQHMASHLGIPFHGPKGAPAGNKNRHHGELDKRLQQLMAGD